DVLVMDGELDEHFMSMLESKDQKLRFVRVDSDIPERLIAKEENKATNLSPVDADLLQGLFSDRLPADDKTQFIVALEALDSTSAPATVTQNEFMRRMKKMAEQQPGMAFAAQMPDSYQLVVNTNQPAVKKLLEAASSAIGNKLGEILSRINAINEEISKERESNTDDDKKKLLEEKENEVAELRKQQSTLISDYAKNRPEIRQIIDLALLQTGLLKGRELSEFISRSISLL
ncbi:MAG: molecular chaperone HtpG, partial [Muribaculaceae bacterium]|nr:molecular chaperone HtpG [Muribaculaceae bacterium]